MKTSTLRFVAAPEMVKVSIYAAVLILLSIFVPAGLAQTPSKTLTPEEQELLKAQRANEEAQAEYYREQTNKLRQAPSPTPKKTFSESVNENPASVVGVAGTILGATIVALVSLVTLYFNSRNAIKAQKDSQFYEAMKRMGDKDSPTVRASAAGLLASMAPQEWREPFLSRSWPFLKYEKSRPYFDTAVDQLMAGHLLETNPVATESIKNALQQLVPLVPHNIGSITRELYEANVSLQDKLASLIAEFFVLRGSRKPPDPKEYESEHVWVQLQSITGFETSSLKRLVEHSSSFANSFKIYRLIFEAQSTGDQGQLLSALQEKLQVTSGHLRANITLFCTALGKLQPKELSPQPSYRRSFSFKRAFLVDGEIAREANLSNIEFTYANFSGMKLYNVNMANTVLYRATLEVLMEHGSLRDSVLNDAEFGGAWIRGVDMTGAKLAGAKIRTAFGSAWWKADFTANDQIDTELLESLFEKDSKYVPTELKEVHESVRTFLERKRTKSQQQQQGS